MYMKTKTSTSQHPEGRLSPLASFLLAAVLCATATLSGCHGGLLGEDVPSDAFTPSSTSARSITLTPTAEVTSSPTPTPSPSPSPTPPPTPSPTPVPQYIEPLFDEVWYNGFVDPRSVRATIVENPDDITVVINKYYALDPDYVPDDLVDAPHSFGQQLRAEVNDAWIAMYDACLEETGIGITLVSGYRNTGTQQYLFDRSVNLRGLAFACMKNAWPGRSEHQTGLALDLTPAGHDNIMDGFDETTVGSWVCEHGHEYGFIHRYQADYIYETGYGIEGWHFRYVGVELATYLYENDMSLEAYFGLEQVVPWDE